MVDTDAAPRLEWRTVGDPAPLAAIAGPWHLLAADGDVEVFRVHAPATISPADPAAVPCTDPHAVWARVTAPARVETVDAGRVVAVTRIGVRGDLTTRTLAGAADELLALHADALTAALDRRAAGVAAALEQLADDPASTAAIAAWCAARLAPKGDR